MFTSLKISRKSIIPWLLALGLAFLYLSTLFSPSKTSLPQPIDNEMRQREAVATDGAEPNSREPTQIARVIDGDTIEVEGGIHVRYIGIDTPEPDECFGKEASEANSHLITGKRLKLETDIQEYDRYARLLAYVWARNILVNEELVRQGFATVTTYAPNVKYTDRFLAAQQDARDAARGLWAENPCPTITPGATQPGSQVQGAQGECVIKGNISSSGEKIYHIPGQRYWERTKIEEGKGERWFCNEEEAVRAGWRKSKI